VVDGWQVGVGKPGEETLLGEFIIGTKQPEPMHFPRGKKEVPYGHPDNPLGTHWLAWRRPDAPKDEKDLSYGFHGTWEDETVGQAASQGCVRMTNDKVLQLFQTLPVGARVVVRA
jgi:lipoprotein-anchoring transpeptidase ErfK/SrfK